ncbi:hypothetical protein VTO42DRAFT_4433 [Malbranchea cinnamomea]
MMMATCFLETPLIRLSWSHSSALLNTNQKWTLRQKLLFRSLTCLTRKLPMVLILMSHAMPWASLIFSMSILASSKSTLNLFQIPTYIPYQDISESVPAIWCYSCHTDST